jgi:ferric-dicitrate binding protein FerR (iron transport regulator)
MEGSKNRGNQLVDHLSSTDGIPEQGELREWIDGSAENKEDFRRYQKVWKGTKKLSAANKFQTDKAWPVVNRQIQQTQLFRRRMDRVVFSTIGLAASLILILGLAFYTGQFSIQQNKMQLVTNYGSRTEVVLPDGSKVKLNSGSSLSYHFNSLTKTREVSFVGEGFFEVAKEQQPFLIHTPNGMDLKVLGTTFNLSAYPEDRMVQTALVEGKVELSNNRNEKLVLGPGQIATFENNSQTLAYQNGNLSHMVGWTENKMYLDNTSLKETSIRLERWFDVDIHIVPESLGKEIHYTGVLEEKTIQEVLDALSELSDIQYSIKGDQIMVSK